MFKLAVLVICVIFLNGELCVAKPTYPHVHDDDSFLKGEFHLSGPQFTNSPYRPRKSISEDYHAHHAFSIGSQEHLPDPSRWPFHHSEEYHKNHGFHHDYHNIHNGFPYSDSDEDENEDMKTPFTSFKPFHAYHHHHHGKLFPTFKTPTQEFDFDYKDTKKQFPVFNPFNKPQKPTSTSITTVKPLVNKTNGSTGNDRKNGGFNNSDERNNNPDNKVFTVKPTYPSSQEANNNQGSTTSQPNSVTRKTVDFIPVTEDIDDIINKIFTPRPRVGSSTFPNIDVRSKNNNNNKNV